MIATDELQIAALGGAWEFIDRYDDAILSAVKKVRDLSGVFVPPHVVKSIIRNEIDLPVWRGQAGVGLYGPMHLMVDMAWGAGSDWDVKKAKTDVEYNIFAGTFDLARRYQYCKTKKSDADWGNAAVCYFSGAVEPNGAATHRINDYAYRQNFLDHVAELDAALLAKGY